MTSNEILLTLASISSLIVSIVAIVLTKKQNEDLIRQNRELSKRSEATTSTTSFDIKNNKGENFVLLISYNNTDDGFIGRSRRIYDSDAKEKGWSFRENKQHHFDSKRICIRHALNKAKIGPFQIIN